MIYIGFTLLIIGMSLMDSDRIDIPLTIAFSGLIIMFFEQAKGVIKTCLVKMKRILYTNFLRFAEKLQKWCVRMSQPTSMK